MFVTDELALGSTEEAEASLPVGRNLFGTEWRQYFTVLGDGQSPLDDSWRDVFRSVGPLALAVIPGGRESLRREVDSSLTDLVDVLRPVEFPPVFTVARGTMLLGGAPAGLVATWFRINDDEGQQVGVALVNKPGVGMTELARRQRPQTSAISSVCAWCNMPTVARPPS